MATGTTRFARFTSGDDSFSYFLTAPYFWGGSSFVHAENPPFGKADDPKGFQDAVILLATLKYSQTFGIGECLFVSSDNDHSESAVEHLGRRYGIPICALVRGTEALVEMMVTLKASGLRSLRASIVKLATEFVRAQELYIRSTLDRQLVELVKSRLRPWQEKSAEILSITLHVTEAIPDEVPKDAKECWIKVFGSAMAELVVEEMVFPEDLGEPWHSTYHGRALGTVRNRTRVEVPVVMRIRARYVEGNFSEARAVELEKPRRA